MPFKLSYCSPLISYFSSFPQFSPALAGAVAYRDTPIRHQALKSAGYASPLMQKKRGSNGRLAVISRGESSLGKIFHREG